MPPTFDGPFHASFLSLRAIVHPAPIRSIANGMKRGFDAARIGIAESLHRLLLSTRSAFAHGPAMSSFEMTQRGMEPDDRSGAEHGRSLERCYLGEPDTAANSTSPTSTAIKPLNATALNACPWRSQTPNRFGRNQAMVQSLVIN